VIGLAVAELAVIVALLVLHARERRQLTEEWAKERSELMTRAMHPQVVLPPREMQRKLPQEPPKPDEYEMVGRILTGGEE
jgi:hypothetical protein